MRLTKYLAILLSAIMLFGCNGLASEAATVSEAEITPLSSLLAFDKADYDASFDAESAVSVILKGDSAACESAHVEITGNRVTITKEGTYIVSGKLDGMIIIHADKQDTVRIVLNNADISSADSAAIYVRSARKVVITGADGSRNMLSNGGEYIDIDDNNIDSVIFSKDDLAINGAGLIQIEAKAGHGVVSKDSLRIANANLSITSASHALSAKDDMAIDGGTYILASGKDGIHAENKDDADSGDVLILGGEFDITSSGDGVSAAGVLEIDAGTFSILSGGGYENAAPHADDFIRYRNDTDASAENTPSCKALKSTGNMYINGGTYDINSADDALHADGDMRISGGVFSILSGDDALHAENNLTVCGGTIDIASCYEGLEAHTIDVNGGNIYLYSSDDGMNAAGGSDGSGMGEGIRGQNPFISDPEAYIHISGGRIEIHCEGDGIDSNGEIRIDGGETFVYGPSNGGNGSLDCGTGAYIFGGYFVALGSAQMAEHFSEESGQCSIIVTVNGEKGSLWSVANTSGESIYEFAAECDFQCIVMSIPEFAITESYTLTSGETSMDIVFDSTLYSNIGNLAFGGMMGHGGRLKMPQQGGFTGGMRGSDRSQQPPEGFEARGNAQIPGEIPAHSDMQMPEGMALPDGIQIPEDAIPPGGMPPPDGFVLPDNSNEAQMQNHPTVSPDTSK